MKIQDEAREARLMDKETFTSIAYKCVACFENVFYSKGFRCTSCEGDPVRCYVKRKKPKNRKWIGTPKKLCGPKKKKSLHHDN